ncbi:hypothetical protein WICPIJ_005185 [Wickerhamomyces pijperi]|uniref:Uncharacterized protein n=1 Tax=Wickerhamomyces pijperi TaxID=599730 RepID=A0A9P8TMJ9_WICPI|nr:hypothetical protein WICPIJ_005185 [Wickerhamomyces pijperi]
MELAGSIRFQNAFGSSMDMAVVVAAADTDIAVAVVDAGSSVGRRIADLHHNQHCLRRIADVGIRLCSDADADGGTVDVEEATAGLIFVLAEEFVPRVKPTSQDLVLDVLLAQHTKKLGHVIGVNGGRTLQIRFLLFSTRVGSMLMMLEKAMWLMEYLSVVLMSNIKKEEAASLNDSNSHFELTVGIDSSSSDA